MAVTSIWRINGWLGNVVIYVENPEKTDNPKFYETSEKGAQGLSDVIDYAVNSEKTQKVDDESTAIQSSFVSGINCHPSTARDEMLAVKRRFGKEDGTAAYHGYQSFAPGEATPEMAHEIGIKLAERLWGNKYQVIVATHADERKSAESFESLAELVRDLPSETVTITAENVVSETNQFTDPKKISPYEKYASVYEKNSDLVGWITIDGTNVNYPVMQTKEDPDFYLKHGFDKNYSDYGVPFIQGDCDVLPSDNLVIYGHNMKNGTMFSDLERYADESFYRSHRYICFDTLSDYGTYEIIAVFRTTAYTDDGFKYYNFVDAEDTADFNSFVEKCKELSLYDTGVTAEYGDKLLTLSTCEYTCTNGRLVVVAKLVKDHG